MIHLPPFSIIIKIILAAGLETLLFVWQPGGRPKEELSLARRSRSQGRSFGPAKKKRKRGEEASQSGAF